MEAKDGVKLLLHNYKDQDIKEHLASAEDIVNRLGGLPLAIDQAAAYIRYKRIRLENLGQFLVAYESQRAKVLSYTPKHGWEYGTKQTHGEEEHSRSMNAFTTWEMSLELLWSDHEFPKDDLTRFLTLSAFFSPTRIDEWLFRRYWQKDVDAAAWMHTLCTNHEQSHGLDREYMDELTDLNPGKAKDSIKTSVTNNEQSDRRGGDVDVDEASEAELDQDNDNQSSSRNHEKNPGFPTNRDPSLSNQFAKSDIGGNNVSDKRDPWDTDRFWSMLSKLDELSLLQDIQQEPTSGEAFFFLHPLICDWLQLREETGDCTAYLQEALNIISWSLYHYRRNHWSLSARMTLLAHLDACASNYPSCSKNKHQLGDKLEDCKNASVFVLYYGDMGRHEAAATLARRILNTRQEHLRMKSAETWAAALAYLGENQESEDLYRQLLSSQNEVLGNEHQDTLTIMNNLTAVWKARESSEVEQNHGHVLGSWQRVLGEIQRDTLRSMYDLARSLHLMGEDKEAEELLRRVLRMRSETIGLTDPSTISIMRNLALLLSLRGSEEASEMFPKALELSRKVLGMERRSTLWIAKHFSRELYKRNKHEALALCRQTLRSFEETLGSTHLETLECRTTLAEMLPDNERVQSLRETLQRWQDIYGENHPQNLMSMRHLAMHLPSKEAEPFLRETIKSMEQILGKKHVYTLIARENLGQKLWQLTRYEEAELVFRETLQMSKETLGCKNVYTLNTMHGLACVLLMLRRYDDAESMFQETVRRRQEVLGVKHQHTLSSMRNLALTLMSLSRYDEAKRILRQTVDLCKEVLGEENEETRRSMRLWLECYVSTGDIARLLNWSLRFFGFY